MARLTPELERPPFGESAGRPRTFSLWREGATHGSGTVGHLTAPSRQGGHRKRQAECRHLEPRELLAERGEQGRRGGIPRNESTKSAVGPKGTGRSGARRWNGTSSPISVRGKR